MKKLLAIMFLGLLFISCSRNIKEAALENCANAGFYDFKDESYDKFMGSRVGTIVSTWGKNKRGQELLEQGYSLNRKINKSQDSHTGEVPKYLSNAWASGRQKAKVYIKAGYNHYGLVADEIVKKTSIKKKAKNELYASFLIKCEKLYNETPDSFILKWRN